MITNYRIAYQQHDHQRCISSAISRAEALCRQQNARLTPTRRRVLSVIWQSHRPLGAYAITEAINQTEHRVLPPTVYRVIDFLLELGLIHRIDSLNAYIGCAFPDAPHSDTFLICRQCGSVAECCDDIIEQAISEATQRARFLPESRSLEILGLCPGCQG